MNKRKLSGLYASGGVHLLKGPRRPAPNKPLSEWNRVRVVSDRSHRQVEWNAVAAFGEDFNAFARAAEAAPGLARTRGSIALRIHQTVPVEFREIVVTPISR